MLNKDLDSQARAILEANDRGGFTVPRPGLYPYQWNWDSAFAALGFATFDRARAWRELETLMEGQWADGMVPHILFRRDDPDYFPGPSVWQTAGPIPSSGHSQPPVAAIVAETLAAEEEDREDSEPVLRRLFPKLLAWHRWYHRARDPEGLGVIAVVHPWESGRDNSPDWDAALAAVPVTETAGDRRRDLKHVDAAERPRALDYDRFLSLVKFGRECRWDATVLASEGPFWVADPGITFILRRADLALLALAERLGETAARAEIEGWLALGEAGAGRLWNAESGCFAARDLRSGLLAPGPSSTAFLAFLAGLGTPEQRAALLEHLRRQGARVTALVPSWDADAPGFEPRRYWRGPIWAVVNYLIAKGLAEAGEAEMAERLRRDTRRLIYKAGFYEYFDPESGAGRGGDAFSWTAAVWLAWAGGEEEGARGR